MAGRRRRRRRRRIEGHRRGGGVIFQEGSEDFRPIIFNLKVSATLKAKEEMVTVKETMVKSKETVVKATTKEEEEKNEK
jgi:hypothetical protein